MHHRSYQSVLPTHNKLLQKRWDDTYFQEHRRRVKTAFPMVSTAAPKAHPHVVNKLKKQQRESERFEVVQRDNNTLMLHMSDIMKRGSYVDHQNRYNHWSLNYNKRANELQRIQTENSKMLGRIQSRPPNYSVSEWVKDRNEKERLLKMITTHPTQNSHSSLAKKGKNSQSLDSLAPLVPLAKEKGSSLDIEISDTDTKNSLESKLEIARNNIRQISKNSLVEIKAACTKPPMLFKLVIEATSILFTHSIQPFARLTLTQRDFQSFDKENIPFSVLEKLKPFIDNPELNPELLKCINCSIVELMEWIRSVYQYGIASFKLKQLSPNTEQSHPSLAKKGKDSQSLDSLTPLVPLAKEKGSSLDIEISDTDTKNSLESKLEIARNNIRQISKNSLVEIKAACTKPPMLFKLVIDATSILFTHSIQPFARLTLTQRDFQSFDKENIPFSVLEKLKPFIDNPELNPERLKCINCSIVELMEWIRSVYQFGIASFKLKQLSPNTEQSHPSLAKKGKDSQSLDSLAPLVPLAKEKGSSLDIEISDTDTKNSLESKLEIARNNIRQISKNSLVEIKAACTKPPMLFKLVIDATSILFTHSIQPFARLTLTQRDFQSFDKENIPFSVLEKLKPFIDNPGLNPERLKCINCSIVELMEWIRSVYQYGIASFKLKQLSPNTEQKDTA